MTAAETFSNIVALIALLVSFVGLYRENKAEKRAHEFDLFRDVYKDYLVKRLPEARNSITITRSGRVSHIDQFVVVLNSLRKDSIYFQYTEPQFFEDLRNKLWNLEDYLIMLPDPLVGEQRVNFDFEVSKMLKEIYQCLLKKF